MKPTLLSRRCLPRKESHSSRVLGKSVKADVISPMMSSWDGENCFGIPSTNRFTEDRCQPDYRRAIRHHAAENGDTTAQGFFVSTPQLSSLVGASVRMATRRFVDKDRAVFVCSVILYPKLGGGGKSQGSTRDDRGLPQARAIRSPMSLSVGIDTWESMVSTD
ncbi:hypothetical protein GQ600_7151 [Phytophthora cactorum]|nr:hypothetical protein GQ600_7151 [Phytophthora cactorum]